MHHSSASTLRTEPSGSTSARKTRTYPPIGDLYDTKITLRGILGAFIGIPLALIFLMAILGWVLAPIALVAISIYEAIRQLL